MSHSLHHPSSKNPFLQSFNGNFLVVAYVNPPFFLNGAWYYSLCWYMLWQSEGLPFSWHDCLFGGDLKGSFIWSQMYLFPKMSLLLVFSHIYIYIYSLWNRSFPKIIRESSQNTFSTFIFLSSGDSLWISFLGVWIFTLHLHPWTFLCQ